MSELSGVKYVPEKGAHITGTLLEPSLEPLSEDTEDGSSSENVVILPTSNTAQNSNSKKGDIVQGRKKKFLVQKSDLNSNETPNTNIDESDNGNRGNSVNNSQNEGNNNGDGDNGDREENSRIGFGGPGPGSGETQGGDGPEDSGRGSSLSQELTYFFKPEEDKDELSDAESTGFTLGSQHENDGTTEPLILNHKEGSPAREHPRPDKKNLRTRFLSRDKEVLLPGSEGSSEDEDIMWADGNDPTTQDKPKILDQPNFSERFIERKGHHSDTSSIMSELSCPGTPALGRIRQFTVVNYGHVPTTPEFVKRKLPTDKAPPSILRKPSPSTTPTNGSPFTSMDNLSPNKSNFLKVETDGPSPSSSRRGSSSIGSFYSHNIKNITNVAKRGLLFAKRKKDRLLNKSGSFNISFRNISRRNTRFLQDVYTTVLDASWFTTIMIFVVAFCMTWIGFGLLWWLIAYVRGDVGLSPDDTHKCVDQVHNWVSAFLFSLETQHTIGYGVRAITEECPEAVILLMMQSMVGVLSQCIVTGFIFSKLARPGGRSKTIMFSRNAVICKEDGQYCLLFRVGDMRHSQLVGAMLHAMFIKKRRTQEGHEIPFYQYHLEVRAESEDYDQFIFLSWPIRVIHRIDASSPLWGVSAEQLLTEDFEIIIVLEGVVEATSMTTQVRTSYLPSEILWGHGLAPLLTCRKGSGRYEIDFAQFHKTVPVSMPEESAMENYEKLVVQETDETDGVNETKPAANGSIPGVNLIPPVPGINMIPPVPRAFMEERARRISVPQVFLPNHQPFAEVRQRKVSVTTNEFLHPPESNNSEILADI